MDSVNSAYVRYFDSQIIPETSRASLWYSHSDRTVPQSDDSCLHLDHLDPQSDS